MSPSGTTSYSTSTQLKLKLGLALVASSPLDQLLSNSALILPHHAGISQENKFISDLYVITFYKKVLISILSDEVC